MTSASDKDLRPGNEPPDEVLAARAREGDEIAFQILVDRHAPQLRQRIRRKLPATLRRKVSESDVLQVAYLAAHDRLARFEERGQGSFRAWVNQIVDHKVLEVLRRYLATAKRSVDREVSRGNRPDTHNLGAHVASPSEHAVAGELQAKTRDAMRTLPDDYREILRLVQDEGFTLAEAGSRMDRSAGAAEKLYGRAIYRLTKAVLGKEGRNE